MSPLLLVLALQVSQGQPPADSADARARACTALVRTEPQRAVEQASAWRIEGGGIEARQCLALAYVALERWALAAEVFAQAAQDAGAASDPRRADLMVQSGNAWLAAGEAVRAIAALDAALAGGTLTVEMRGEVHIDRARALVANNGDTAARVDIDRALELVPSDPMAWYLSAALRGRAGDLMRARADATRAMQLAPDNPDIALFAGTLAGTAGDMAEAERLYRRVAQGAPDSPAGREAQASLETLREVEVPAPPTVLPAAPQPQSR